MSAGGLRAAGHLVSEIGRNVDGEGGLAHTTLLIQERDDHIPTLTHYLQCANVAMSSAGRSIEQVCRQEGYAPPVICVPHERAFAPRWRPGLRT